MVFRRMLLSRVCLVIGILVLTGCETAHPTSYTGSVADQARYAVRRVEIVPLGAEAAVEFNPSLGPSAAAGASRGAATSAGTGAVAGVELSLATGPFAPVMATILVPVMTLAGAAEGGVLGAVGAVPNQTAADAGTALAASSGGVSALFARRVAELLPGIGKEAVATASAAAADARMEIALGRWGLVGGTGSDPPMAFFIEVSWRLVARSTAPGPGFEKFIVEGARRPVSEWTANDAKLLRQTLDETLSTVAEELVDRAFLVQRFHVPGHWSMEKICGLEALAPVPAPELGTMPIPLTAPAAESLTPVLRWSPFPSAEDRKDDVRGLLARVSGVRYDLRIWKAVADRPSLLDNDGPLSSRDLRFLLRLGHPTRPGELVYERRALDLPVVVPSAAAVGVPAAARHVEHRVESVLAPDSVYMWTVRARFVLDGSTRVTPWSYYRNASVQPLSCALESPPPGNFYRFRTP
jgi:hypothetical protein